MKPTKHNDISEELQQIAEDQEALILSFVAPDKSVKVSPIGVMYASIDIDDLYEIERVVEGLEEEDKLPKRLHLVIQTPGGLVSVSTKIATTYVTCSKKLSLLFLTKHRVVVRFYV